MSGGTRYVVTRDFAGVKDGRASSPMTFGDANRHAMDAAARLGEECRVFAECGQFIVSYARGASGKAVLVAVGEAAR